MPRRSDGERSRGLETRIHGHGARLGSAREADRSMIAEAALLDIKIHLPSGGARLAGVLVIVSFLLAFLFIRTSARLMRSPKVPWWPGSVTSGDLHINHLVWGIILLLLCGFLGFAIDPQTPWTQILAVLFGIGAGFTLDE